MLKEIQHYISNPEDVPDVPLAVKNYLQVRYNYTYLNATHHIAFMRSKGCSESHILGFIEGLAYASEVLDEMEQRIKMNKEEVE